MTTTLVPSKPIHTSLAAYDVDKTITGRDTNTMISNVSFLMAKNTETVVQSFPDRVQIAKSLSATDTPYEATIEWFYIRSPSVTHTKIGYEIWPAIGQDGNGFYGISVDATFPAGITYPSLGDEAIFTEFLAGAERLDQPVAPTHYSGIVDVSTLPTNSVSVFKLHYSGSRIQNAQLANGGLHKVNMFELPKNAITVGGQAQTGSIDSLSTTPYRYIVDGSATTEYGFARILDQTKVAKTRMRHHWQIINTQGSAAPDLNAVWTFAGTTETDLLYPLSTAKYFYIRTRNYDGQASGLSNRYTMYIRYRTLTATNPATFYIYTETEPNNITNAVNVALPPSTPWTTASVTVDLRQDSWRFQREQLVKVYFRGKTDGINDRVYVSAIALIEDE